jgi:hypothetical protein
LVGHRGTPYGCEIAPSFLGNDEEILSLSAPRTKALLAILDKLDPPPPRPQPFPAPKPLGEPSHLLAKKKRRPR